MSVSATVHTHRLPFLELSSELCLSFDPKSSIILVRKNTPPCLATAAASSLCLGLPCYLSDSMSFLAGSTSLSQAGLKAPDVVHLPSSTGQEPTLRQAEVAEVAGVAAAAAAAAFSASKTALALSRSR